MKWTLREIREYPEAILPFSESLEIEQALMAKEDSIISVQEVKVDGYLSVIDDAYILHGTVEATLTLPSSRSLTPVELSLTIPIRERYVEADYDMIEDSSEETVLVLDHDYIDLDNSVVDTIILNIPHRILAPGEETDQLPSGKDWEVLTQDQYEARLKESKENHIDPRFAALKTMLDEDQ
ncbi:YceD family protein [Ignavigranum ruoffiae]|uniref:YceD family protein n=1 Tax=Ignavigranum ruoffiae TaxID=89093 RepID=UPI0024ADD5B8|nr:YceD family protein [Ignavigranum ruoffiae]